MSTPPTLFTIGNSTRSFEEFVALLRAHGVRGVLDIRTIPRSRHNPQYDRAVLAPALRARRIGYRHVAALGGLRHARRDSPNGAWRNASFRGFADYMATPEFDAALAHVIGWARARPLALMCAEAVPWRCHRSLVADALVAQGAVVFDIVGRGPARPHRLTPFARVAGGRVSYPGPAA